VGPFADGGGCRGFGDVVMSDNHLALPYRQQLIGAARDAHPFEACGVITRQGTLWTLRNLYAGNILVPDLFAIHPEDALIAWPVTAAIWHTHPGGRLEPSERDTHGHPPLNAHDEPLGMVIATLEDLRVVIPW
jgi:proteasome lid subunit RPN8/RPN11